MKIEVDGKTIETEREKIFNHDIVPTVGSIKRLHNDELIIVVLEHIEQLLKEIRGMLKGD